MLTHESQTIRDRKKELLRIFEDLNAVKRGPAKAKSKTSPYFIDFKKVHESPQAVSLIADIFAEQINFYNSKDYPTFFKPAFVVGFEIASAVSKKLNLKFVPYKSYLRGTTCILDGNGIFIADELVNDRAIKKIEAAAKPMPITEFMFVVARSPIIVSIGQFSIFQPADLLLSSAPFFNISDFHA